MTTPGNDTASGKSRFVFDFDTAVAEARRDFPKETADTTFINGQDPDALQKLFEWAKAEGVRTIEWAHMSPYMDIERPLSFSGHRGGTVLVMHPQNPSPTFKDDPDKSNQLTFDHELGHIVSGKGMGNHLAADYTEHVADSFAVIRGLKRGSLTREDIPAIAAQRDAGYLLFSGLNHLTSMSLDAIAINPLKVDFQVLSPQQTIRLAEKHASVFENKSRSYNLLDDIADIGKPSRVSDGLPLQERVEQRLDALTSLCLSAKPSSMVFYLAARILTNAIDNNGAHYLDSQVHIDGQSAHWQSVREAVQQRAGDRDIGARKALQSAPPTPPENKTVIERVKSIFTPLRI